MYKYFKLYTCFDTGLARPSTAAKRYKTHDRQDINELSNTDEGEIPIVTFATLQLLREEYRDRPDQQVANELLQPVYKDVPTALVTRNFF